MDQQRLSGHANGGPTAHLSLVLGQRWLATGGPLLAHRWLATVGPTVGQQRPTGGYSHRWANRGSLDKPTVGHRWLPPLAQQRTYRWCTVGPPLGQRWLATGGPTEAHRWLATVGPTVGQQRPTGGYSHRWANRGSLDKPTVGHRWLPPLAQQRTYRWCTVGPPLGQRWLATGGPTEAHRWLATVGPTVGQQRPTGG